MTGIERMFVHPPKKIKGPCRKFPRSGYQSRSVANKEPTTQELRRKQHERVTEEHQAIPDSITPDEERQHRRRAAKSAYLERKLAERERSERETED